MEQKKKNEKDVLVVRDEKTGEISVVAGLDSKGYPKTAPAKAEHSQDFLRFDRHGDMVDNFFRNFYRQCKEPTRFGFYRVAADMADAVLPVIKDLLKDPAANAEMLAAHKVDTSEYRKQAETENVKQENDNEPLKKTEEMEQKKSFFINELNREEQWMLLFSNEFSDNKDELLSKVKEEFAGMRKEFFSVAKKLELIDKEQLKKTADIYFELCEKYIRENNKNADALDAWCWVCRNEIHEIETISKNISFNAYVIKLFRQRMAATSQESAEALSIGDILFLKEKKILPLGANWGFLDVVGTLYDADPNYQSEEFLQIRNKIVLEHNDIIKKIYLSALTEKREMLLRDNIKKEITYNVALLEEQIRQDLKGTERSVLESVTMAVWRTRIEKEKILTAFQLLEIILCYGNQKDYGVYDGEYVKESILRELFAIAQNKIEVFEDKQLVNEYRKLNRTNKILMEQSGIMQCLQELPKEWQQDYAVRSERNKSGWLLTGILSGVFVLAGIAAEVLFFIFYNHININIAVLTGILLSAAGIVGAIVVLICMLISLNR